MQHDHILKNDLTGSEVKTKVKVTQKWNMKLRNLKMHPHTIFGIPISINIGDMSGHDYSRNEVRGQCQYQN